MAIGVALGWVLGAGADLGPSLAVIAGAGLAAIALHRADSSQGPTRLGHAIPVGLLVGATNGIVVGLDLEPARVLGAFVVTGFIAGVALHLLQRAVPADDEAARASTQGVRAPIGPTRGDERVGEHIREVVCLLAGLPMGLVVTLDFDLPRMLGALAALGVGAALVQRRLRSAAEVPDRHEGELEPPPGRDRDAQPAHRVLHRQSHEAEHR